MFFEGSEKKVEVVVSTDLNLRELGDHYWSEIVSKCSAQILSINKNENVIAYLLSESSLFVWDHKFVLITCGRTVLLNSVLQFIKDYSVKKIDSLIFQRKNEYQAREQKTCFLEDVRMLKELMPGKAYRLGYLDGHHNFLFHMDKDFCPDSDDMTTELLMYHINGNAGEVLRSQDQRIESIRSLLNLEELIPKIKIDDHLFDPFGYSLNALIGDRYITIHITPQEGTSYVSFETNLDVVDTYPDLISHIVSKLTPDSFDIVTFDVDRPARFETSYQSVDRVFSEIGCGYQVSFTHYMKNSEIARNAIEIKG